MATKKEGAQRLIDSLDSQAKIKPRLAFAAVQGVLVAMAIAWFTQWQFGIAAALVFLLLIQFAFERLSNSILASKLTALKVLGWNENGDSDEILRQKAEKILK